MEKDEVFQKVKEIIADTIDITSDEISMDSSVLEDIELSSLDVLEVVTEIESIYGISFTNDDFMNITTVEDFVNAVLNKQ